MNAIVAEETAVEPKTNESKSCCDVEESPQTLRRGLQIFGTKVRAIKKKKSNMGQIERGIAKESKSLLREALRDVVQDQADSCPPVCPVCGTRLKDTRIEERTLRSEWGEITIKRVYGYCPNCQRWMAPVDEKLGIGAHDTNTPSWAEKMTYIGTKVPMSEAAEILEHLTGEKIAPSRVERETKRTSEKALADRGRDVQQAMSPTERHDFAKRESARLPKGLFTLVILIDGWMMRERDDWGRTEDLRAMGKKPERWHEVKTGRFYLIESHEWHEGSRPSLEDSGYLATRLDADGFSGLVWTEAVRYGLLKASRVLVISDGGVWIWKIIEDRFSFADKELDFYHASQHLWVVAHALYGEGTEEAQAWVEPLLHQLRHGGEAGVISSIADLCEIIQDQSKLEIIQREQEYFEKHQDHMDYDKRAKRGEPIGSGAVESAAKRYHVRFKRNGQFWSRTWDEGLLQLKSLQMSGRWHELWLFLHQEN